MLTKFFETNDIEIESSSLKEYILFKNENIDYILLFQIGAFFETFFEDAKIFSDITGSALGMRNFKPGLKVIESGIPKDKLQNYIKQLLNNGLKVCVCREFKNECGKPYREITRKYTQGTIIENEFLDSNENNYLCAIYFKDDLYNFAYADVSTGQLYKTICNKKELKNELDKISPKEIIISINQKEQFEKVSAKYNIIMLNEECFKDNVENTIELYCADTQKKEKIKLNKPVEYKCRSYMLLDDVTRKGLEFTRTNYLSKKKGSILWFLNYTKTPMGIRLLKKFLNEPMLSKEDILKRQEAVEELVNNNKLTEKIQLILEKFCDLSRMCSKLSNITIAPKDLINLISNADLLRDLKDIVRLLKSNYFKIDSIKLDKLLDLSDEINAAIKKDCSNELKSGNIINEGYSASLDFLKNELINAENKIKEYEYKQRKKLDIDVLTIKYMQGIGYFVEVPIRYAIKMPKEYYKKQSTSTLARFSTNELKEYEDEISSLKFKISETEYKIFKELRLTASNFVEIIRNLAFDVAMIDVVASLAKSAIENKLTKPEITETDICIEEGFHPSLIKLNNEVIKNDTNLKSNSMIILTGANMSGKSTYLKQNAIISILAQIGSFVPAKRAKLPILDKIIFRQGSVDDIINNNSSFMVEMNDLKFIIENITNSSFVLLDEPAKSTSVQESAAISKAFCEYILNNYSTKTIIATHNLELTKLEEKYPNNVENYVMGECFENGTFDRKIKRGVIDKSYAINAALLADLPDEIIKNAKKYMKIN